MNDLELPSRVVTTVDGGRGARLPDMAERGVVEGYTVLAFNLRIQRGEATTRYLVRFESYFEGEIQQWGFTPPASYSSTKSLVEIAIAAVALDTNGLVSSGVDRIQRIPCLDEQVRQIAKRPRVSDDQILAYLKGRLFWSWKHDITVIGLSWADALVLGCPLATIDRVSKIAEGEFLTRTAHPTGAVTFEALPKLLKEFPLTSGSSDSGSSGDILLSLAAPRYVGPREHLRKAVQFLASDTPDSPNAVKEALCAVEGVARIASGDSGATLGTLIDRFKGQGKLNPALARALEAVWGFSNTTPGARHGAITPITVTKGEAEFVLASARAAIALLLPLDNPAT